MLNKYSNILKQVQNDMGDGITYNDQLDNYAKTTILKNKNFLGVFPQNMDIKIINKYPICCWIINTSPTWKEGEHWIALWKEKGKIYQYDSFGRSPEKITPILNKSLAGGIYYEDIKEQDDREYNCGQRSLTWLLCCAKYGVINSIKI